MTTRAGKTIKIAGSLLLLVCIGLSLRDPGPVKATTSWETGDVFIAVGGGQAPGYAVYSNNGTFKESISDPIFGSVGYTSGAAFNASRSALYTTYWQFDRVVLYDVLDTNHKTLQAIDTRLVSPGGHPESIVFDRDGNFYVGNHQNDRDLIKYDSSGTPMTSYTPAIEAAGIDRLALSTDQATMFYTSEGRKIKRFDVVANAQLPDFAVLPGAGIAHEFRLLPPGDGSGGLLVADSNNIKRLNGAGTVIFTYTAAGQGSWMGLDLDPNGTSFWAVDSFNGNFYRINITTGAMEASGNAPVQGNTVGLVVMPAPASGGCPFLIALEQDQDRPSIVNVLYRYRDEVLGRSAAGRSYIDLFYVRAPETSWILLWDGELRRRSHGMISRYLPVIESVLAGRQVLLSPFDVRSMEALLDAIASRGSAELQSDIRRVKLGLRAGEFKQFGIQAR